MVFPTLQFLLFILLVFLFSIYFHNDQKRYKIFLLIISLIFYSLFGWQFFLLLLVDILVNFLLLKFLYKTNFNKTILIVGVVVNVGLLCFFKYNNFVTNSILQLLTNLRIPTNISVLELIIPVGISFYTFRIISHLVDVYNKKITVPSLLNYANYVTFFPQIASGPIARANKFYENLDGVQHFHYNQGRVFALIISGLIKKLVIASFLFDYVGGPFSNPENYSRIDLLIAGLAYTALIYVDFSGYSDFAIAISNLLGFYVPDNFNAPYKAIGFTNFWSRWHISLSTWFKDYVYIPLGGNRKGEIRKYFNIFITMFISGLWHGAGINFIIWGTIHALGSVVSHLVEAMFGETFIQMKKSLNGWNPLFLLLKFLGWFFTFVTVSIAWVFFNSKTPEIAFKFLTGIFSSNIELSTLIKPQLIFVVILSIGMSFYGWFTMAFFTNLLNKIPVYARIIVLCIVCYIIIQLGPELMPPFIYFNF